MPLLEKGQITIDYTDVGAGSAVILIHSSVSGNRQWRSLVESLKDRHRVAAINLFGYGETTPWSGAVPQSLYAQAQLILALCDELNTPISLVGHSFGGSVALKTAALLGEQVEKLILLEPNPFHLLKAGRLEAYQEAWNLSERVGYALQEGGWYKAAECFADYWLGDGAWMEMPEKRRTAFADALPPIRHEMNSVFNELTDVESWKSLEPQTLVVSDRQTRRPIREIVEVFEQHCPHWTFHYICEGGHMAPLTRPDIINPIVSEFLLSGN